MIFSFVNPHSDPDTGYTVLYSSQNRVWHIGIKPVIFGKRIVVWKENSFGPAVDLCAGADTSFLIELSILVHNVLLAYPETSSHKEIEEAFPTYARRPVNLDPDFMDKLRQLSNDNLHKIA